jgi:murein DD-endopeptidase MepM/ murein hydrolase activator NlpD
VTGVAARRLLIAAALALAACSNEPVHAPGAAPAPSRSTVTVKPAPEPQKPAWVARKVVPDAVETPQGRFHTVKPGETAIAIARAYGVPWSKLVALNNLKPPYTLEVGDRLKLPSRQQVAAQPAEEKAKVLSLSIDDLITGGEPAEGGKLVGGAAPKPAAPRPSATVQASPPPPAPLPDLGPDTPRFAWPVDGRVLSGFGPKPGGRFNDGVNLKATRGQAVRAAADGIVAYAGDAIPGFGNLLLIKHAGGWVSAYAHNDALLVQRGDKVRLGEPVARAGQTGAVDEPQLHFELRRGRTPVDPVRLLGGR